MHAGDHLFIILLSFTCSVFLYTSIQAALSLRGDSPIPTAKKVVFYLLPVFICVASATLVTTLIKTATRIIPSEDQLELILSLAGCFTLLVIWISVFKSPIKLQIKSISSPKPTSSPRDSVSVPRKKSSTIDLRRSRKTPSTTVSMKTVKAPKRRKDVGLSRPKKITS